MRPRLNADLELEYVQVTVRADCLYVIGLRFILEARVLPS